ncbi:MAG: hypothetical protein AAGG53_15455 [Cyanobacteria bacterium P01_H01_bin.152]
MLCPPLRGRKADIEDYDRRLRQLMVRAMLAIALTQKIARYPIRLLVPQYLATLGLTASL